MNTTVHGGLPPNIRDRNGVFGEQQDSSPQAKLAQARLRVKELEHKHAEAHSQLTAAVGANDGKTDLNELSRRVKTLAGALETAEEALSQWESVNAQVEKQNRRVRFDEVIGEARQARRDVAEHYRLAAEALAKWYRCGSEASELANLLADKLGNGSVYYVPELKCVLQELSENPDPLPQLLDGGYFEPQYSQSWRRQLPLVPLKKEK